MAAQRAVGAKSLDARPGRPVLFLVSCVLGMIGRGATWQRRARTAVFDPVVAGGPALGVLAALLGVAQLPALAQTAQMASKACWSSGSSQHAVMC